MERPTRRNEAGARAAALKSEWVDAVLRVKVMPEGVVATIPFKQYQHHKYIKYHQHIIY